MKTRRNLVAESISPVLKRKTAAPKNSRKDLTAETYRRDHDLKGQESRIKTPKTNRRRELKAQTPGRDDILCSQHFDSQTVVGWDCNSPASVRNLAERKLVSEENDDVEDLVSRLIGDEESDRGFPSRNTPPLLGLWRDKSKEEGDGLIGAHRRQKKRTGRHRKKSAVSAVSHEVLEKLQSALNSCSDVDKETEGRHAEGELYLSEITELDESDEKTEPAHIQNVSNDLFESFKGAPMVSKPVPKVCQDQNEEGKSNFNGKKNEKNSDELFDSMADTTWSDDELFGNDSFIVHATQVPSTRNNKYSSPVIGGKRKSNNKELPRSKCTRYSNGEQFGNKKDVPESKAEYFTALVGKQEAKSYSNPKQSSSVSKPPLITKPPGRSTTSTISSASSCRPTLALPRSKQSTDYNKNVISNSSSVSLRSHTGYNSVASHTVQVSSSSTFVPTASVSSSDNHKGTTGLNRSGSFKKYNSFSGAQGQNNPSTVQRQRSLSGNYQQNSHTNVSHSNSTSSDQRGTQNQQLSKRSSSSTFLNRPSSGFSNQSHGSVTNPNKNSNVVQKSGSINHLNKNLVQNVHNLSVTTANNSFRVSHVDSVTVNSGVSNRAGSRHSHSAIRNDKSSTTIGPSSVQSSKSSVGASKISVTTSKLLTGEFDTSLSDELLDQLAESDDGLDDQFDTTTMLHTVSDKKTGPSTKSVFDTSKSVQHTVLKGVPKQENTKKTFTFKPSQKPGLSKNSAVCQLNTKTVESKSSSSCDSLPSFSAAGHTNVIKPVKLSVADSKKNASNQCKETKSTAKTELPYSEDLFSDDDDLLTDTDGLTEAQIFAMLDEAELMATQKLVGNSQNKGKRSHDSAGRVTLLGNNRCNQPDKEQGRDRLNHKHNATDNLCQTKQNTKCTDIQDNLMGSQDKPNSQEHMSSQGFPSSQGQLASSQGQISSSQGQISSSQGQMSSSQAAKYSAAEIERKKQLALERRQKRLIESKVVKK